MRTKILYVRNRRVVAFVTVIVIDIRFARKIVVASLQSGEARLKIEKEVIVVVYDAGT